MVFDEEGTTIAEMAAALAVVVLILTALTNIVSLQSRNIRTTQLAAHLARTKPSADAMLWRFTSGAVGSFECTSRSIIAPCIQQGVTGLCSMTIESSGGQTTLVPKWPGAGLSSAQSLKIGASSSFLCSSGDLDGLNGPLAIVVQSGNVRRLWAVAAP